MVKTVSPGLQTKNLCIFLVGFIIDPSAQTLGTSFRSSDFSLDGRSSSTKEWKGLMFIGNLCTLRL